MTSDVGARSLIEQSGMPEHEAIRLLAKATGATRAELLLDTPVAPDDAATFDELVRRRHSGEPLQYIEGDVPFGGALITVDERVLIPRPETEEMLHIALARAPGSRIVVDLCTGSGNLAIAIALAMPDAEVFATDISPDAVAVARSNAESNGVPVSITCGNLFDPLPESIKGSVDLLVANPPYLADHELAGLDDDVLHEPHGALTSGPLGDEVIRAIGAEAAKWLAPGGTVACEVSEFRADVAPSLFVDIDCHVEVDMFGKPRFVIGTRRGE